MRGFVGASPFLPFGCGVFPLSIELMRERQGDPFGRVNLNSGQGQPLEKLARVPRMTRLQCYIHGGFCVLTDLCKILCEPRPLSMHRSYRRVIAQSTRRLGESKCFAQNLVSGSIASPHVQPAESRKSNHAADNAV